MQDFPDGPVDKNLPGKKKKRIYLAIRGHGFDPWSRKFRQGNKARAPHPLSQCAGVRVLQQEKTPQTEARELQPEYPSLTTRESLCGNRDPTQPKYTQKNILK